MMPFIPWFGMGDAKTAPGAAAAPRAADAAVFPGRNWQPNYGAAPAPLPPAPAMQPDVAAWSPVMPTPTPGPGESPEELALAQSMIEDAARQQDARAAAAPAAAAGPGVSLPRAGGRAPAPAPAGPDAGGSLQALIASLNQSELKSLSQQGLSTDKLKAALGQLQTSELPTDLTPLAALTDNWTGSNFAQTYKPSETARERRAAIEKLQGQITASEQGMTESEIAALKNKLGVGVQLETLGETARQHQAQNSLEEKKLALEYAKLSHKDAKDGIDPTKAFDMRIKLSGTDSAKQARGITSFSGALNEYEQAVRKYGIQPTGTGAAILNSAYAKMSTTFKEAEKLGALSGPDLNLLKQNVANAGGWDTYITSLSRSGKDGILAAIGQARKGAANDWKLSYDTMAADTAGLPESVFAPVLDEHRKSYARASGTANDANAARAAKEAELAQLEAAKKARTGGGR